MEWGYLWLWIILAGVFLIGEIFTAGFFLLWFGVAAGVTAIVSIFGVATTWQLVTFVVLSLGLLMISRPFADKVSGEQPAGIGANRLVGEKCRVLEDIDPDENTGRVRLGQDEWRAESGTGEPIAAGQHAEVVSVHGTRLVVAPVREG